MLSSSYQAMAKAKKRCRKHSVEYLKYGYVTSPHNTTMSSCLLCEKSLSNEAMKPSKMMDHLKRSYTSKSSKDMEKFKWLRYQRKILRGMFESGLKQNDDGIRVSYNIALKIAKAGKSCTIGETLITPAVKEILKTVLHKDPVPIMKTIALSNGTVQRRLMKWQSTRSLGGSAEHTVQPSTR